MPFPSTRCCRRCPAAGLDFSSNYSPSVRLLYVHGRTRKPPDVDPASTSARLVSGRYFPCVASDLFDAREEGTPTCMSFAKMRKLRTQRAASLQLATIPVSALPSTWSLCCQPQLPVFGDAWYVRWTLRLCRMLRHPRQIRRRTLHDRVNLWESQGVSLASCHLAYALITGKY